MDKAARKKLKKDYAQQERAEFEKSLPMPRGLFEDLFDFLDENLGEAGCLETPALTIEFLEHNDIDCEPVLTWLAEHGGYCDCEILANVEEKFRADAK